MIDLNGFQRHWEPSAGPPAPGPERGSAAVSATLVAPHTHDMRAYRARWQQGSEAARTWPDAEKAAAAHQRGI
jgi:hypothetical protein